MKSTEELDSKTISYKLVRHSGSAHTAVDAAKEIGLSVGQIVKTLAFKGKTVDTFLVLIPGDKKFDRKKIGAVLNDKTIDLLEPNEVEKETGYRVGLVTPFGDIKPLKVYAQKSILELSEVGISSGELGAEIVLSPKVLISACQAVLGDFCQD